MVKADVSGPEIRVLAFGDSLFAGYGLASPAESYPALKSDTTVIEAQRGWTEAEAQITAARRFYNAAVTDLNNAVQVFPGSILAALAGARTMPYFETPPETRAAPDVDELLPR